MLLRVFNITLSMILLVLTTGFTISQHFCREQLMNTGVFSVAEVCEHEAATSCCAEGAAEVCRKVMNDDCCRDQSQYVKFDEQFTLQQKYELPATIVLLAIIDIPQLIFSGGVRSTFPDYNHSPPFSKNLQVLFQTFLL